MKHTILASLVLLWSPAIVLRLSAQAPADGAKPDADILIFKDGEKLIGHLESASGSSVLFKSDMAGEVKVDWANIQELRSAQKFAAVPKGAPLRHREDASKVPQGSVVLNEKSVEITPSAGNTQTIPASNVADLVPQAEFEKALHHYSLAEGWSGGATAGVSLTEATQKNQSFTGAVNLVRAVPAEDWLELKSRTIFDYNQAYGKLTQPGTPEVKTSLFHFDLEQDWYVSPRVFVFGQAIFDHSFSQGLDLQQTYGGGVGLVLLKRTNKELDFKASADYVDQRFSDSALNKQLIGSIFGETYVEKFPHGITLNEQGGFTPAWNDTSAYSAFASAGLTFPVYHRFGFTVGALDNFLNDPPPGFKKNSFQFTLGATYTLPAH